MMFRLRLAKSLLPLVMAAVVVGGCSTGGGGTAAEPETSTDPQAAALAFAKCMRENGVDIPDPKPVEDGGMVQLGPGGPGAAGGETFEKAQKACAKYAEDMGGAALGGELSEADKEQMLQFSRCMREQGIDMPDPDFDGGVGAIDLPIPSDAQGRAKFEAAQEACDEFFGPPQDAP